ncbi:hypothetical protein ABT369_43475 [Dactylosporangium sp. NPDC000244]|uniref:hypothetical protein n=1 Tax=Dactylosporangium sp. NPDC000244 TaxID=3154365 RepID=UPI003328ABC8
MSTRTLLAVLAVALSALSACGDARPATTGGTEPGASATRPAAEEINGWKLPTAVAKWTLMTNGDLLAMGKAGHYTDVAGMDMLRGVDGMPGSKDDGFDVYDALAAEKHRGDAESNSGNAAMRDVYARAEVHAAVYEYAGDPRRGVYVFRSSEPRMASGKGPAGCDKLFSGGGIRCTRMEDGLQWTFLARVSDKGGPTAGETREFINAFLAAQGSQPMQ